MNRETKTIQVGDNSIVMNTFITGKEFREYQNINLRAVNINETGAIKGGVKPEVLNEAQDFLLKKLIVSINGNAENIVDTVLNLPQSQSDEIIAQVNSIAGVGLQDKKKA